MNECLWYAMQGDPHWDDTTLWTTLEHLYVGGIWFKKKAKISGFTDSNYNGADYRIAYNGGWNNSFFPLGKPSNLNDYFYLPALGLYIKKKLGDIGDASYYWSSTPHPTDKNNACILLFDMNNVIVGSTSCSLGAQLWTAQ